MPSGSESVRSAVVTGASGYLGSHLGTELDRHRWRVTRCVRGGAVSDGSVRLPDLDDASLASVPMDVDVVFHVAGLAHRSPPNLPGDEEFRRVNALGSEAVARAARNRARRFVLVSSIAALGGQGASPMTARTPPTPQTAYGRSKLEGEQRVRDVLEGSRTTLVILRFPAIYGPGAPGAVTQLAHWISRHRPIPSCARHARRSMIAIENAVDALLVASESPALDGATALPHDRDTLDVLTIAQAIAAGGGTHVRTMPCSAPLLRALARILDVLGADAAASANRLLEHSVVEDDTLLRLAGWNPKITALDALGGILRGRVRNATPFPGPVA